MRRVIPGIVLFVLAACGPGAPETREAAIAALTPSPAPEATRARLSPEAQAYFAAAATPVTQYGVWLGRLGAQSRAAGKNTALFADPTWRKDMGIVLESLRLLAAQLDALDGSGTEAESIDTLLRQVAHETGPLTDEYTIGVERMDAAMLQSAVARVQKINGWIAEAAEQMQRLQ